MGESSGPLFGLILFAAVYGPYVGYFLAFCLVLGLAMRRRWGFAIVGTILTLWVAIVPWWQDRRAAAAHAAAIAGFDAIHPIPVADQFRVLIVDHQRRAGPFGPLGRSLLGSGAVSALAWSSQHPQTANGYTADLFWQPGPETIRLTLDQTDQIQEIAGQTMTNPDLVILLADWWSEKEHPMNALPRDRWAQIDRVSLFTQAPDGRFSLQESDRLWQRHGFRTDVAGFPYNRGDPQPVSGPDIRSVTWHLAQDICAAARKCDPQRLSDLWHPAPY
jgi:hypothetical protein